MTSGQAAEGLTRRAVLEGVAAVGAASFIGPAEGLAATLARSPALSRRWVGALDGVSPELGAPRRFALVGVQWAAPARAGIELRTRARGYVVVARTVADARNAGGSSAPVSVTI